MSTTSSTIQDELKKISAPGPGDVLYTLHYRKSDNPHAMFLFFWAPTRDMKVVVERIKRHCEAMNYRFVHVQPAIVDIDKAEKNQGF